MSVHWPIIRRLVSTPFRRVITDDQRTYTGASLLVASMVLADEITRRCHTQTVAIALPTSGLFPIAALAGWIAGKTIVPLNYLLKEDELNAVLDDCRPDTLITAQPMLDFMGYTPKGQALIKLDEVNFKQVPEPRWPASASDDDLAVLLYTSGTSGKPKGVMLTHGNLAGNIRQIGKHIRFGPEHTLLGMLPQFHSFGLTVLTLLPLTTGSRVVYAARFVPQRIVRSIREHRPTAMIAIPSMYNAILHVKDAEASDFASLQLVVSGGEPLPSVVAERFKERFNIRIAEGYGLTETSPVSNWCRPWECRPGSVGIPLPEMNQRIVDIESGAALGPGLDGEVRMKGPNIMAGYFNRSADTAAAFDDEGWFRTGDIGRFDADNHLYITGRLKEMLIVAGENVFPREIEEVINAHPCVKDSGVVGMHDPMRGELPIAFVECKEGAEFDQALILKHCRENLAGYKVPREVRRLEAMPRNATGKVMRRELKKLV